MNNKKTALVTGGAGFIGSHICDFLLKQDYRVICMDNLITGSLRNIEHITSGDFIFINHNITDDIIVMAITSNISMKEYCINLNSKDLISGFLLADSQIRADKIYSISKTIVIKKLGSVKNYIIDSIKNCITNLFDVSHQPIINY